MYKPFAVDDKLELKSNQEFDTTLKLNHSKWGIQDLWDLEAEASRSEITLCSVQVIDLPANNKLGKRNEDFYTVFHEVFKV